MLALTETAIMTDQPDESLAAKRWARTRELLYAALELRPADRGAWLDRQCGSDRKLRVDLDSLIAASEATAFIDKPVVGPRPPDRTPSPGDTFRHYKIGELLGRGGMGVVFKAVDSRLDRPVALKLMLGGGVHSDAERRRFLREARAASALNHPGIVTVYEFDTEDGIDYIAMEYIEGQSLADILERRETPLPVLLEYAKQIALAVGRAHDAGIVHRDLKPANVMVTRSGEVKVLDFGVARRLEPESGAEETRTQLTMAGTQVGTPSYMAPEQILGDPVDHRADIFAFGVILYQMVCGRRPFEQATVQRTYMAILGEEPVIDRATPSGLAALIRQCLAKKREDRLPALSEAASRLHASLTSARPKTSRRGVLIASALAALGLAGAGSFALRSRAIRQPTPATAPLSWSIEAQKMHDGKPLGERYLASASDVFEAGWHFRLRAQVRRTGFLYLINQGPGEAGALRYWILHPSARTTEPVHTVEGEDLTTGWLVFDQNPGTERIWILWSATPLEPLEKVRAASRTGEVGSGEPAASVSAVLARQPGPDFFAQRIDLPHR